MKALFFSALFLLSLTSVSAQDSLLIKLLHQNKVEFSYKDGGGFSGAGWEKIIQEANNNQYFLIGETHGINELPLLIDGITKQVQFQTFVAEIDPWLAKVLEDKVKNGTPETRQKWFSENNSFLSFYSFQNDFKLLETLAQRNVKFAGIDQITLLNDVPVYEHLATLTRDKKRKATYLEMAKTSRKMLQNFDPNSGNPTHLYLASAAYSKDVQNLRAQKLSAEETNILDGLKVSQEIYTSPTGHYRRINLMKQQLLQYYKQGVLSQKVIFRIDRKSVV